MSYDMAIPTPTSSKFWNADMIRGALLDAGQDSLDALKAYIDAGGSLRKVTKVVRKLMGEKPVHPQAYRTDLSRLPERFQEVIFAKADYLMNLKFTGDLLVGLLRSARDAIFRWFKVGAVEDAKQVLAKLRPIAVPE